MIAPCHRPSAHQDKPVGHDRVHLLATLLPALVVRCALVRAALPPHGAGGPVLAQRAGRRASGG